MRKVQTKLVEKIKKKHTIYVQ